jgi:hypothetical protein
MNAIRRTQAAVLVVAAIHVVALVLIYQHQDVISAALAAQHPGANIEALTHDTVLQSAIPHLVLAVLLPVRALRLRPGRPGSRVVLTVILCIQILAHATLPITLKELPGYEPWIIVIQAVSLVFEVFALYTMWSRRSRTVFGRDRAAVAA